MKCLVDGTYIFLNVSFSNRNVKSVYVIYENKYIYVYIYIHT